VEYIFNMAVPVSLHCSSRGSKCSLL